MEGVLAPVQVLNEGPDPAIILKDILFSRALVNEPDPYPGAEKGELTQPVGEDVVVELDAGEGYRGSV